VRGARYINPLASQAAFPELVELHESQHAYLSLANTTDSLGRLFAGVLDWGANDLNSMHKNSIEDLFRVIYENTVFTQELYATYTSFCLFGSRNAERLPRARRELPKFYKEVLAEAEEVFGVADASESLLRSIMLVNACAIAAMNVRYPKEISFDDIDKLAAMVTSEPPDARMRKIMHAVRSEGGLGVWEIDVTDQKEVFDWLRQNLSEVDFFTFADDPSLFRRWTDCLIQDSARFGYRFLEGKRVAPHPEDSVIERMGASLEHPGMEPWEPIDLSLKHQKFASGTLSELELNGRACASVDVGLFLHVFVLPHESNAHLFAFAWSSVKSALVTPFSVACSVDVLIRALLNVPHGGVVVKIDERMDRPSARRMATTGHPCFVLAHDTRPKHIVEVALEAAVAQQVLVGRVVLTPSFGVMLLRMDGDGYCFMAPVTPLGVELVERELANGKNIVFPTTEEEFVAALRLDRQRLMDLCYTCYVPLDDER
jgi:hypothetical protein